MTTAQIWWTSAILAFAAGGIFMWFAKESIQKLVLGANALSAKLHAKADALKK